jgi:acyl-coenzyme A synthetase/AMP-(fatty) acid ligase
LLLEHPDVTEVAVFGFPHRVAGDVTAAYVVTSGSETAAELQQFCRERAPAHKVPALIAQIENMPKNAAGKIRKDLLKKMLLARLK